MTDSEKLLSLADWFDKIQESNRFPEWSESREVQADLRRIAERLDRVEKIIISGRQVSKNYQQEIEKDRQTGRTTRQLESLAQWLITPPIDYSKLRYGIFYTHNHIFAKHCFDETIILLTLQNKKSDQLYNLPLDYNRDKLEIRLYGKTIFFSTTKNYIGGDFDYEDTDHFARGII